MKIDKFKSLIDAVASSQLGKTQVDWGARRDWYKSEVDSLFSDIERWLRPLKQAESLSTFEFNVDLEEQLIGQYNVKGMVIALNNKASLYLTPKGTLLIGAAGRIDLTGPFGTGLLALKADKVREGETTDYRTSKWFTVDRANRVQSSPLNEESFLELIAPLLFASE
jgi:hypothetical protein